MRTKPQFLLKKTLLAVVRGSVNSKMFRRSYFRIGKKEVDVLENGNLSCAFYLTGILKIFDLVKTLHTTVDGTEKDLRLSGWKKISKPKMAAVIVYAPKLGLPSRTFHRHLGFYIGGGKVIHNHSKKGYPIVRRWNHRPVQEILFHPALK